MPRPHRPANPAMPRRYSDVAEAVGANPTMLAADASLARLGLARDANVLTMAVETAQDAGAETAAQKMVAHQLAGAHPLAMELLRIAAAEAQKHRQAPHMNSGALAEAARTTTAAARLMDTCARGALILDRLLNGARQTVTGAARYGRRWRPGASSPATWRPGIASLTHRVRPGGDTPNERGTPCVATGRGSASPPLRRIRQAHWPAVSASGDGEWSMPNAWRRIHRAHGRRRVIARCAAAQMKHGRRNAAARALAAQRGQARSASAALRRLLAMVQKGDGSEKIDP